MNTKMRMIYFVFVLLCSCETRNATVIYDLFVFDESHKQVEEILQKFSGDMKLSVVIDYETLDVNRKAFVNSYRDSDGRVQLVAHALDDNGVVQFIFYAPISSDIHTEFITNVVPILSKMGKFEKSQK